MQQTYPVRSVRLPDIGVGFGVGAFSGILGVGGGILLIPFLVIARGFAQKRAQATSLVMVACAALFGAVTYAVDQSVAWIPALLIFIGGMVGSLLGSALVLRVAGHLLQGAFAVLMIVVAGYLLVTTTSETSAEIVDLSALSASGYVVAGVIMGILSGLFGIGGGIVLIPILVGLFGFSQQLAAGTSLAVMAPVALIGALRLTRSGYTDWRAGLTFGIASIPGALIGAAAALAISGELLRIGFAIVMAALGIRMFLQAVRSTRGGD